MLIFILSNIVSFLTKSIKKICFHVEKNKKRKYILLNRFYLNLNLMTVLENQLQANKIKINVKYSKNLSLIYWRIHLAKSIFSLILNTYLKDN